jgi:hypothetical protein
MKNDAALMYAEAVVADKWETDERGSYDVDTLRQEYRERLYSEKAVAMLKARSDERSK